MNFEHDYYRVLMTLFVSQERVADICGGSAELLTPRHRLKSPVASLLTVSFHQFIWICTRYNVDIIM